MFIIAKIKVDVLILKKLLKDILQQSKVVKQEREKDSGKN